MSIFPTLIYFLTIYIVFISNNFIKMNAAFKEIHFEDSSA